MTKTEFFKIMREQAIHADAFIDVCDGKNTFLNNPCNPNASLTAHRSFDAAARMVAKLAEWLEEFRAIELAHAEALAMNDAIDRWSRPGAKSNEHLRLSIADAHAEALAMNAEADEWNEVKTLFTPGELEYLHGEALAMDAELSAQDQARKQTVARRNSLSHKIGLAFAGAALLFSGMTHAEVVPSYPVDASRMSLEGSVAVSIDCDAKKVDVLRESTSAAYFSRQVKAQVWNICYGQTGTLDRVYTFVMNKKVGAHDMLVNNSDRHPL